MPGAIAKDWRRDGGGTTLRPSRSGPWLCAAKTHPVHDTNITGGRTGAVGEAGAGRVLEDEHVREPVPGLRVRAA